MFRQSVVKPLSMPGCFPALDRLRQTPGVQQTAKALVEFDKMWVGLGFESRREMKRSGLRVSNKEYGRATHENVEAPRKLGRPRKQGQQDLEGCLVFGT